MGSVMVGRAMSAVSNPIETLPEIGALAWVRRWHEGWVRYHEARYRYLGQILDCAAIPCCEFSKGPPDASRARLENSHGL